MAEGESRRIARELMSEPHVRGRRISVRQLYALVEERGEDPEAVADRYGLDVADVYHALACYHDRPRKMREAEREREDAIADFRGSIDRPEGVEPVCSSVRGVVGASVSVVGILPDVYHPADEAFSVVGQLTL